MNFKKIVSIVVAVAMMLSGCSGSSSQGTDKTPQVQSESASQLNESAPNSEIALDSSDMSAVSDVVTVAEQVIFDDENIKITAKSLETDGFMGAELKLLIENNSEKRVIVQSQNENVNDVMLTAMFSTDIDAGKKANDSMTFMRRELEAANITTIKDIELNFVILDPDSYRTLYTSETISVSTTANSDYVQTYDDNGSLMLEQDGLRIVAQRLNSNDSFWGSEMFLFVENNCGEDVVIQVDNVSVNGFMVTPMFSCYVLSDKKAFDEITFLERELTENNISDIEELELEILILSPENYTTIFASDKIKISF